MKKFVLLLIILIGILAFVKGSYAQEPDFRQTRWGMTRQEVLKVETGVLEEDILIFRTTYLDYAVALEYAFYKGQLIVATYIPLRHHQDVQVYYAEYLRIAEHLIKEHGQPHKQGKSPYEYMQWLVPPPEPRTQITLSYNQLWILKYQQYPPPDQGEKSQ